MGNGISFLFLRREAEHNLNVRGAMPHMLADLMPPVAVLAGGLVMLYRPWHWPDAVLSLSIVASTTKSSWPILIQAARILMEGAQPRISSVGGLDLRNCCAAMRPATSWPP